MSNYTGKGSDWEYRHSRWVIWSYCILGFVSFLIIGHGAKQRKWTIFGLIYAVIFTATMLLTGEERRRLFPSAPQNLGGTIGVFYWIITIVHCHLVKREYLMRRAVLESEDQDASDMERIRREIRGERHADDTYTRQQVAKVVNRSATARTKETVQPEAPKANASTAPIDINSCTVEQLASLPGVSMVMAKKADMIRRQNGGFGSADEFFEAIQLKPHFVVQARNLIVCDSHRPQEPPRQNDEPVGRRLDL